MRDFGRRGCWRSIIIDIAWMRSCDAFMSKSGEEAHSGGLVLRGELRRLNRVMQPMRCLLFVLTMKFGAYCAQVRR